MKFVHFWKSILWLAIICYGLFIPASSLPTKPFINIPHFDKLVHFSLFFILCLLLFMPLKKLKLKYYYLSPSLSIALGLLLETIQHLVTVSRSSDPLDFLANTSGIAAATLFFHFFVSGKKWEKFF